MKTKLFIAAFAGLLAIGTVFASMGSDTASAKAASCSCTDCSSCCGSSCGSCGSGCCE